MSGVVVAALSGVVVVAALSGVVVAALSGVVVAALSGVVVAALSGVCSVLVCVGVVVVFVWWGVAGVWSLLGVEGWG